MDLSTYPESVSVLRCAEGETLAGGSKGAGPSGKFSGSGKATRLFRWSGAWWLATMRNLPNNPNKPSGEPGASAGVVCGLAWGRLQME